MFFPHHTQRGTLLEIYGEHSEAEITTQKKRVRKIR